MANHSICPSTAARLSVRRLRSSVPLRLCVHPGSLACCLYFFTQLPARADVTAEQVNESIKSGVAFLEKQQRPDGQWSEYPAEPGGATALITLALLNCGRTPKEHESVRKALAYLERQPDPER